MPALIFTLVSVIPTAATGATTGTVVVSTIRFTLPMAFTIRTIHGTAEVDLVARSGGRVMDFTALGEEDMATARLVTPIVFTTLIAHRVSITHLR